jgi:all-trans-retinol dehydrogenase (NAD+)
MFKGAGMPPWMRTVAPVLRPEYVVQRIVEAIKRRNPVLIMPRLGYLSPVLRATLPTVLYDWVCATTGVSSSMDNFVQTRQEARSKL